MPNVLRPLVAHHGMCTNRAKRVRTQRIRSGVGFHTTPSPIHSPHSTQAQSTTPSTANRWFCTQNVHTYVEKITEVIGTFPPNPQHLLLRLLSI